MRSGGTAGLGDKLPRLHFGPSSHALFRIALLIAALFAGTAHAAGSRIANYTIAARLDVEHHSVNGTQTLSWTNPGQQPVDELVFHLYMNAFASDETRFARQSGGQDRRQNRQQDRSANERGKIEIKRLTIGGAAFEKRLIVDETLATLKLDTPVAPGATIEIFFEFVTTLPRIWSRTGFVERFFAVGQWFPKIAVYECPPWPGCGFVAQQFHAWSEFYSDFGDYQVTLDVPADYEVAGCGILLGDEKRGGRRNLVFASKNVHDFSWFASPDFSRHKSEVKLANRKVELELFAARGTHASIERHLKAVRFGLLELERQLLPYPYPKLTIVLPPPGAEGAGGMEYPTLITGYASPSPPYLRIDELVALHELVHQIFYGVVASNEPEEAWLDEGLTEFVSSRLLDKGYGGIFSLGSVFLTMPVGHWLATVTRAAFWPIAIPSYTYPTSAIYASSTYSKTASVLAVLQERLGRSVFDARLRAYVEKFQFRHPHRADFVEAMTQGSREHALLDALLSLDQPLDYAIAELECKGSGCQAIVQRMGPALDEVRVRAHLEDGSLRDQIWSLDEQRGQATLTLALPSSVAWVEVVSPLAALDGRPSNDARRRDPASRTRDVLAQALALASTLLLGLVGP